jgi:hypothetical protein
LALCGLSRGFPQLFKLPQAGKGCALAECFVLKTEEVCDENNAVTERIVFYYEHYTVFDEMLFREIHPRTAAAPIDICRELDVFPGIYELVFAGEETEPPALVSIRFIKPGDLWAEALEKK